jgi:hypothetical protein
VDTNLVLNSASTQSQSSAQNVKSGNGGGRRGYPVFLGHTWSNELVSVLVDEYFPLIEQGYELDSLVVHFIGGRGFEFDHPMLDTARKAP